MRLPKSSTLEKSYSILVNNDDNEKLKVVVTIAAREIYSAEERADFGFPIAFNRKTESILTIQAKQ